MVSHPDSTRTLNTNTAPPQPKRYARIAPLYKAMIWTSFFLNLLFFIVMGVVIGIWVIQGQRFSTTVSNLQTAAGDTVAELQDVIDKLESATIVYSVPLDTRLPIEINVPIKQTTVVTLTEPVSLNVPAGILFPSGGGNLNATVAIELPPGLRLPINLDTKVPLTTSIPVTLDVPVRIPLAETELGPQFKRLGAIVDRLVAPTEPLLRRPSTPPDSNKDAPDDKPDGRAIPSPVPTMQ